MKTELDWTQFKEAIQRPSKDATRLESIGLLKHRERLKEVLRRTLIKECAEWSEIKLITPNRVRVGIYVPKRNLKKRHDDVMYVYRLIFIIHILNFNFTYRGTYYNIIT